MEMNKVDMNMVNMYMVDINGGHKSEHGGHK
jgi:hypothetical protein